MHRRGFSFLEIENQNRKSKSKIEIENRFWFSSFGMWGGASGEAR